MINNEAKLWFNLSNNDYKNALLLWKNRRYGATVFFFQQAVEKMLKAYIVENKRTVPSKTHRIEVLIEEADLEISEINSPDVTELSKAYIRVRYPDINKLYYTRKERVEPLVKIAKKVYIWTKKKFKKT